MGCGISRIAPSAGDTDDFRYFYLINLSNSEIHSFVAHFRKVVDVDTSGSTDLAELLSVYNLDDSPYIPQIFRMVARENSKRITLREFILCIWHFLTRDEESLKLFTFQIYDYNKAKRLTKKGLRDVLLMAYAGSAEVTEGHLKIMLENLFGPDVDLQDDKITISYTQFEQAVHISPHIIQHALQLQDTLRQKILGRSFWKHKTQACLINPNAKAIFVDPYEERRRSVHRSSGSGVESPPVSPDKRRNDEKASVRHVRSNDLHSHRSKDGADKPFKVKSKDSAERQPKVGNASIEKKRSVDRLVTAGSPSKGDALQVEVPSGRRRFKLGEGDETPPKLIRPIGAAYQVNPFMPTRLSRVDSFDGSSRNIIDNPFTRSEKRRRKSN